MLEKFIPEYAYSHFNILILDSNPGRGSEVGQILGDQKYRVKVIHRFEDFFSTIREYVPHVILWPFEPAEDFLESLNLIKNKLPETHIIMLFHESHSEEVMAAYENGIYDTLFTSVKFVPS